MAEVTAGPASALGQVDALVAHGRALDALDLLCKANRENPDDDLERRLAVLRNAAFADLVPDSRYRVWPVPSTDLVADGPACLPELAPSDLSADAVRRAIAGHGAVRVPGLLSPRQVQDCVADIDRALAVREESKDTPYRVTSSWFAGLPLPKEQADSLGRGWIAGGGGVLACDAPKVLDRLLATYDEVGLHAVITNYLGERPILSANKCTLRLVPLTSSTDWHQDGAFLGPGIRALNVWVALSDCGVDAPGLDLVPRRFDAVQQTGTGGAIFDWAVGPDVVAQLAVDAPVVRPVFGAGDAVLFDDLYLHRTAIDASMTNPRYAIESWFFAATDYPEGQVPLVW